MTTPRGYKVEGLVLEDNVKVCGVSVAVKPETHEGYVDWLQVVRVHWVASQVCADVLESRMCRLAQVLRASLPYGAKRGEILVQELVKGGNKVCVCRRPFLAPFSRGPLTLARSPAQLSRMTWTTTKCWSFCQSLRLFPRSTKSFMYALGSDILSSFNVAGTVLLQTTLWWCYCAALEVTRCGGEQRYGCNSCYLPRSCR